MIDIEVDPSLVRAIKQGSKESQPFHFVPSPEARYKSYIGLSNQSSKK